MKQGLWRFKQASSFVSMMLNGEVNLVGPIHLKLNAHLVAGLVLASSRIHQGGILVIGVVLCHHDVQHYAGVGDLQIFALRSLKLHNSQQIW